MLGNLLLAETITDTQIWTDNDVWNRWICLRIAVAEVSLSLARNDVLNGGFLAVLIEIPNSFFCIVLILEEEQRNIVRLTTSPPLVSHTKPGLLECCSRLTV